MRLRALVRRDPSYADLPLMNKVIDPTAIPLSWDALEDAFENNASEVHSYLHRETGEVLRLIEGVSDQSLFKRVSKDANYLSIDPVPSREQYRWMEHFIDSMEDDELRGKLRRAVDGRGAFRRFKDVLAPHRVDRERWFRFRSDRLREAMERWLSHHNLKPVERETWHVPTAEEVIPDTPEVEAPDVSRQSTVDLLDDARRQLRELVEQVPPRKLETARLFMEFLCAQPNASRTAASPDAVADKKKPKAKS